MEKCFPRTAGQKTGAHGNDNGSGNELTLIAAAMPEGMAVAMVAAMAAAAKEWATVHCEFLNFLGS